MHVHIQNCHLAITDTARSQICACIQRVLRRFAEHIADVTVQLRVAHGSDGEVDTHCRMLATLSTSKHVLVETIHAELGVAIARTSTQLARAIQGQLVERDQPIPCAPPTARIAATTLFRRRSTAEVHLPES